MDHGAPSHLHLWTQLLRLGRLCQEAMAAMTIARGLKEKRSAAKSDQALRRVLSFLDHNNNHKIRLEDFIDMMEEHSVEMEAEEVLELCELTEVTGEICHSTLIIFIKNAKVWRFLEKQVVTNGP